MDALSDRKLAFGSPLTVLGVTISLEVDGVSLCPEPSKLAKWSKQIQSALDTDRLCAGEASKLAGINSISHICVDHNNLVHARQINVDMPVRIQARGPRHDISTIQTSA